MKPQSSFLIPVLAFSFLIISSPLAAAVESPLPHPPSLASPGHTLPFPPATLKLPLGHHITSSPGARAGSITTCNRVYIRGLSRLRHSRMFAHALKLRLNVSQGDAVFRAQTIELCLHRNVSLALGMCPAEKWEKLAKSYWVQMLSPFEDRILDIRTLPDPSRTVELSTEYEFLLHRLFFLVVGVVMMVTAHVVSKSVVFYYGSAMTIGVILVVLMVLFQGMKLLPTGRKSSLAIFMYSSVVGVATFLLRYLSGLVRSLLVELGISEDMHNPLGIFLLVCLVLAGAWFGYWGVRKLVLTDDGVVESGVAYFVEWAILIFAAAMILQSSLDPLLAVEALCFAIMLTAISRTKGKTWFFRRLFRRLFKYTIRSTTELFSPSKNSYDDDAPPRARHRRMSACDSPIQGLMEASGKESFYSTLEASGKESFYSTFHKTPEKKKFSKEEWESFTREQTSEGLRELISSPDFNQWALANADRITVTPLKGSSRVHEQQRHFWWF